MASSVLAHVVKARHEPKTVKKALGSTKAGFRGLMMTGVAICGLSRDRMQRCPPCKPRFVSGESSRQTVSRPINNTGTAKQSTRGESDYSENPISSSKPVDPQSLKLNPNCRILQGMHPETSFHNAATGRFNNPTHFYIITDLSPKDFREIEKDVQI